MHTPRNTLLLAIAATLLMALSMGTRSSFGLLISPLNTATGLGLAMIGLAAATGQLVWGLAQPLMGAVADRRGAAPLVGGGCLLFAAGHWLLAAANSVEGLIGACALVALAGAAAGSNGILLGEVARVVSPARRGLVLGIVGAGGSIGQLVLSPATQVAIDLGGPAGALRATAFLALLALPLAWCFPRRPANARASAATGNARQALRQALRSRHFWAIAGSFTMCGFHVTFLTAHMPGVIASCGLPAQLAANWLALVGLANIASSVLAGAAMPRIGMSRLLVATYLGRAAGIAIFIAMPKSELTLLAFGLWMGLTYMATLPPTVGLVGARFGQENVATLIGVVMLLHQTGAFFGAWMGGIVAASRGDYSWMWYADLAAAVIAVAMLRGVTRTDTHTAHTSPRLQLTPAAERL